ncbi:MAG: ABC transporter ATP-binding protein [Deltaproteobacteria bacterium]|nr:ABC transporter ATP-binding protein [Deltaproteobacteria bacterium]
MKRTTEEPRFALERLSRQHLGEAPSPGARLRALLALERRDLVAIVAFAAAVGVLGLATPVAVQALLNSVAFLTLLQPIVVLSLLLTAGLLVSSLLVGLQTLLVELLSRRVFVRVLSDFAIRLPRVRHDAPEGLRAADRVDRFFDVVTIEKATATLLFDGLAATLQIAAGMALLAVYHPLLLAFDAGLALVLGGIFLVLGRGAIQSAVNESKQKYAAAEWLQTVARHEAVFQTASGASWAARGTEANAHAWLDARERHFRVVFRQLIALLVVQVVVSSGLLALGGALVIEGQLSLGQLVAAEIVLASTVLSLSKIGKMLGKFYDLLAAVDKIGSVLDLPVERCIGEQIPAGTEPLELRVVDLRVDTGDGHLSQPLGLHVAPGERVALRKGSGCSRRALLEVLVGRREVAAGAAEVGGYDVRDLEPHALRDACAHLAEIDVIPGTLRDNVLIGREMDSAALRRLLESCGLGGTLTRLPDGLETHIDRDGGPLGIAELPLLMLARALCGAPRVLLIDRVLDTMTPAARRLALGRLESEESKMTIVVATDLDDVAAAMQRTLVPGMPHAVTASRGQPTTDGATGAA